MEQKAALKMKRNVYVGIILSLRTHKALFWDFMISLSRVLAVELAGSRFCSALFYR